LDNSNIAWRLAFTGGSVTALQSAASAGLGVAAIGRNHVPADCVVLDQGLPKLPEGKVTLLTALSDPIRSALIAAFSLEVGGNPG
jgi:DNA-binding transcriptional LysR family regulator